MKYRNKKNGKIYLKCGEVLNCTNAQDGQKMVMYRLPDNELLFVRELEEFNQKFEVVNELN